MAVLGSLWGLAQRVRVAPEPVPRSARVAPPAPLARPTLPATAPRFEQLEQAVWARYRPVVCAAVSAALADEAAAQRAAARPVCCGHPMRRHDARAVTWQTWVGRVHATVDRYRCRQCGAEQRPLLDVLGVEPGRLSGWLARHLALLGSVVPYTLAAELAAPLLGVHTHAMMVWRAVQRLGAAAQTHTDALSTYHAAPTSVAPIVASPPPAVVVAVDGCVIGTQARSTRRRRPTKTTPLAPLPPVLDGTFREVKTAVLLQPTDRVALPDRAALVRRVVVTGLTDADGLFRQVSAALRERGWLNPQTMIVIVGDGAEWIWHRAPLFAHRCEILDFWHAMEYAWAYARLQFGAGSRRAEQWTGRLAADLKAGHVHEVIARLHVAAPARARCGRRAGGSRAVLHHARAPHAVRRLSPARLRHRERRRRECAQASRACAPAASRHAVVRARGAARARPTRAAPQRDVGADRSAALRAAGRLMGRAVIPADFRARLETARLDTLALLRALDRGLGPHPAPTAPLATLAHQDADCGEALWALDQPPHTLDLATMLRDTTATLARLPRTRQHVRDALPPLTRDRIIQLEQIIRAALDPREAYNDIPGRDPQNC